MRYFRPHSSIPNHYDAVEALPVTTSDLTDSEYFRFSRVIAKNYIENRGMMLQDGRHRLHFYPRCNIRVDDFVNELLDIMIDNTMTILHYHPEGYIQTVITGVKPDMYRELPAQFKAYYYD